MQITIFRLLVAFLLVFYPLTNHAYVGPGIGLGAIGLVLGIIGSILLALIATFWYPLKRLIKAQKQSDEANNTSVIIKLENDDTPAKSDVQE